MAPRPSADPTLLARMKPPIATTAAAAKPTTLMTWPAPLKVRATRYASSYRFVRLIEAPSFVCRVAPCGGGLPQRCRNEGLSGGALRFEDNRPGNLHATYNSRGHVDR